MAPSTTGKGPPSQRWPKLPADHPLFSAGWIIGQTRNFVEPPLCRICGRASWHLVKAAIPGRADICVDCRDSPWGDPLDEDLELWRAQEEQEIKEWQAERRAIEAGAREEGKAEAEAFDKHRAAQRRPWPVDPTKS